jgi:transposase-like protein
MNQTNPELKQQIMVRIMPPNNESVSRLAKESGVSEKTLFNWKKEARAKGGIVKPTGGTASEKWSTQDKFAIVVETAALSEIELSEYCRAKGLYVEQVGAWRDACLQANGGVAQQASKLQKELRDKDQQIRELSRELKRKESALAETAALLVLRKKAQAIWGEPGDE